MDALATYTGAPASQSRRSKFVWQNLNWFSAVTLQIEITRSTKSCCALYSNHKEYNSNITPLQDPWLHLLVKSRNLEAEKSKTKTRPLGGLEKLRLVTVAFSFRYAYSQ